MQIVIPSSPSISCHPTLDLLKSLIILIFSVPLGPLSCHTHPLLYFMYTTNLPPTPFSILSHPLLELVSSWSFPWSSKLLHLLIKNSKHKIKSNLGSDNIWYRYTHSFYKTETVLKNYNLKRLKINSYFNLYLIKFCIAFHSKWLPTNSK